MQVIGVVDLLAGRAVHARAGTRRDYRPVQAVARSPIEPGDAVALARAYVHDLGVTDLYVADLDAILPRLDNAPSAESADLRTRSDAGDGLVRRLAAFEVPLWLDAGISSVDQAQHALELGVARVIVGLETLPSYEVLEQICVAVGGDRVAFSLDLRNGEPIVADSSAVPQGDPADVVAGRAVSAGVGAVIVIDLARVGADTGLDFDLIARVREATPGLELLAGGGVRGPGDLARLAACGCDGALVATALHDGRLSAADVAAARRQTGSATLLPRRGAHSSVMR